MPRQSHRAVRVMLCGQQSGKQRVVCRQRQRSLPEHMMIGIARSVEMEIKVMGRGILLIGLPVLRKDQPGRLAIRVLHGHAQLHRQLVGKVGDTFRPAVPRPDEKTAETAAIHEHAAAPEVHRLRNPQLPQRGAAQKGVIPHPPHRGRQGNGLNPPRVVFRRSPAAGDAQGRSLRGGLIR
ncbi:hypothetical protein SDC9_114238 [bioreactor metagenome]|uniref:Uncharacterized protein n=1 Tax=bioreactor metagenome TaxID=1076179 RepID=A0A645BPK7_9ZZZZ